MHSTPPHHRGRNQRVAASILCATAVAAVASCEGRAGEWSLASLAPATTDAEKREVRATDTIAVTAGFRP